MKEQERIKGRITKGKYIKNDKDLFIVVDVLMVAKWDGNPEVQVVVYKEDGVIFYQDMECFRLNFKRC